MNQRRMFLKGAAAVAAAAAVTKTNLALAAPEGWTNIIFTKENPGIWAGREGAHVPIISVSGRQVTIKNDHVMTAPHYIVRQTLVLADGTFVDGKVFTFRDEPVSRYQLPAGYSGTIYATSFCNLHDLWIAEAVV